MSILDLILIAVGLSMDACAVSICKGLACREQNWRHNLLAGLYFGGFQALMPVIGYLVGVNFSSAISSIDHWVAFVLLAFIGGSMIKEAFGPEEAVDASFRPKEMLTMAVATSIDALAIGVSFAFLPDVNIAAAAGLIAGITFVLSAAGISIGSVFGSRFKSKAEIAGGVILIGIGLKILLEHLGILA